MWIDKENYCIRRPITPDLPGDHVQLLRPRPGLGLKNIILSTLLLVSVSANAIVIIVKYAHTGTGFSNRFTASMAGTNAFTERPGRRLSNTEAKPKRVACACFVAVARSEGTRAPGISTPVVHTKYYDSYTSVR